MNRLSRLQPAPALVALLTFAGACWFWGQSASLKFKGDITGHLHVGRLFIERSPKKFRPSVLIEPQYGFDGQQFLYLALDPLLHRKETRARLDDPFLRARRIGYPLLAHLLSLRRELAAPWMMFIVCAGGVALGAGLLAQLARQNGGSTWLGLAFAAGMPVLGSLQYVTSETLMAGCLIASFFCYSRGWLAAAAAAAAYACLVREMALAWPAALVAAHLARREFKAAALFALAPLPLLLWLVYLRLGVGLIPSLQGDAANFSLPLMGITRRMLAITLGDAPTHDTWKIADLASLTALLLAPFAALAMLWRGIDAPRLALLLVALVGISLPANPAYWYVANYPRQILPVFMFLSIIVATQPRAAGRLGWLAWGLFVFSGASYLVWLLA